MARQAARSELVEIIGAPPEFVDQRAQGERRIDHAAGDHHVGTHRQRARDRRCAQVSVGGDDLVMRRERRAGEHFAAFRCQFGQPRDHLVALDHRDLEVQPRLGRDRCHPCGASRRIDPAGVGDDPRAGLVDQVKVVLPHPFGEVERVARIGASLPHHAQQRHRCFGQVIEREVIDTRLHQLRRRHRAIAVERAATTDTDHFTAYFRNHCASHANTVRCHCIEFLGLSTQ